jgi:hypothetical protein
MYVSNWLEMQEITELIFDYLFLGLSNRPCCYKYVQDSSRFCVDFSLTWDLVVLGFCLGLGV